MAQVDELPLTSPQSNDRLLDAPKRLKVPSLVLLLIIGALLAVTAVFAKAAPTVGWHPLTLLLWSLCGASVLRSAGLYLHREPVPDDKHKPRYWGFSRHLVTYQLVSGLLFVAPSAIAFAAAPHVGAGFVTLTYAFPLVLTYVLSLIIGLERLDVMRMSGVLFGLAGGALFALNAGSVNPQISNWILGAISLPVLLALGNVYRTLRWPANASPEVLSVGMMAVGFGFLLAFAPAMGVPILPDNFSFSAVGLLIAQILLFTVQYALFFQLQRQAGPVYLSQIGCVSAAIGLPLAFTFFHEIPSQIQLGALVLVVIGIVMVNKRTT
ncbi:DMT family transporter [Roseibium sp. RKSG952]|uniref:DMT family transporter n=1 Tax=Roseibium sp. RKSG952 TaxID=2529384 RepID=UPI0012BD52AE|nr:DMT family transporter [Roseibium sp. RKSG952]MTH95338.1 DMT family transporter [Roseibium sp. RKSG952]